MSYNSYLLLDEKTVLFDTVDRAVQTQFFENLEHALGGRRLDYVFVHHMEPDHAATLGDLMIRHPEATIVCNGKSQGGPAGQRGGRHLHRPPQLHLLQRPHGPLAGGDGEL